MTQDNQATRRGFLTGLGSAAAGGLALSALDPTEAGLVRPAQASRAVTADRRQRRNECLQLRIDAAMANARGPLDSQPTNGDEARYARKLGSFSKTLPHNAKGEVDPNAYRMLVAALATNDLQALEQVPAGGTGKLVNPLACDAFDLEGADSNALGMPAPPAFASAEMAGEAVEVWWLALTRDVPFRHYATDPDIALAASELAGLTSFSGPRDPARLFRGSFPGDDAGPYVSQFLLRDIPYGPTTIVQKYRTLIAGGEFLTDFDEWLRVQNGVPPSAAAVFDATPRYIRSGRDLATYVRGDFSYQAFLNAALILLGLGAAAQASENPYRNLVRQAAFSTFGGPFVLDMVARAGNAGLRAAWFQKWKIHRRVRPEEFGGTAHNVLTGAAKAPIHKDFLQSEAIAETFARFGTYLLPMAYPEGCPAHTAYPAGHATIAGACSTILKAFFNEDAVLANPVEADADGLALLPYSGAPLTVGGELNKLASNISLGRDTAGVHWRSDGVEGMRLGEQVGLSILRDFRATYAEDFGGFTLTRLDGTTVTI